MGYISHNFIVCVSHREDIADAHAEAKRIFGEYVSEITKAATNGYCSFLIPPDGSKEGWQESENGDKRREEFIKWLKGFVYVDWVEVSMPEDYVATVINGSKYDE